MHVDNDHYLKSTYEDNRKTLRVYSDTETTPRYLVNFGDDNGIHIYLSGKLTISIIDRVPR